jgi:hypothetical protein
MAQRSGSLGDASAVRSIAPTVDLVAQPREGALSFLA